MSGYYLDTSALVKRYAQEQGTVWIAALTDPAAQHDLFLARLAGVEMIATFARHARRGAVNAAASAMAIAAFRSDWEYCYQIVEMTVLLFDQAMHVAERHGLRGYDAVHLACALLVAEAYQSAEGSSLTLVSADIELLHAGALEGLAIENPNEHP